jgi:tetratricopeptide (TPR) repeat protein
MENSELIEDYFTSHLDAEQVRAFEKRIESEPAFAEEVAFYLSAHTMSREVSLSEKKQQFRALYQKSQSATDPVVPLFARTTSIKSQPTPIRKLIYYMASAAVVAGIIFGVYTLVKPDSPQQMAIKYEKENLITLGVNMGDDHNSLQTGLSFYNDGKLLQALEVFEQLCQKNNSDSKAIEYAGKTALRLSDYDKALGYFKKLESVSLFSNPALFYQAVTRMDRNQPGDIDSAKQLLLQVVQKDQEGKEKAQKWLHDWPN